jgi:hypothetical protein
MDAIQQDAFIRVCLPSSTNTFSGCGLVLHAMQKNALCPRAEDAGSAIYIRRNRSMTLKLMHATDNSCDEETL